MYTFRNAVVRFPEKARNPDNWDQGTGAVFGEASLKGMLLRLHSVHLPPPWLNQVFLCFPEPIVLEAVGDADAGWISVRT